MADLKYNKLKTVEKDGWNIHMKTEELENYTQTHIEKMIEKMIETINTIKTTLEQGKVQSYNIDRDSQMVEWNIE